MRFEATDIPGVLLVEGPSTGDPRGSFTRLYSRREFEEQGLVPCTEQASISHNHKRGTVRGLHYQMPPFVEAKLVCCVAGSAFDAVVDLRRASPTYGRAFCVPLAADQPRMVYVPEGCAHGFQTLADDTTILYLISARYEASAARGIRWNDPALGIPWPLSEGLTLSERDRSLPHLRDVREPL
jgi:dTDP-4-dehydrorhamnose 3,5-epimerase